MSSPGKRLPGSYPIYAPQERLDVSRVKPASFPEYLHSFVSDMFQRDRTLEDAETAFRDQAEEARTTLYSSKYSHAPSKSDPPRKMNRPKSTSSLTSSATSATVPSRFRSSSSSSSSEGSSPVQSNYKSVLEIIQEHTEGRVLPNEKHVNISKTPRMEDDSLGNGSRIYWKHRQKIRILPRNKKAPVTNVVEDLFDSDLMDAIEWTTAESRRPRISEDPAVTSLSNIQAELKEHMLLIHMLPETFGQIAVRASDIFGVTIISDSEDDVEDIC